MYVIVFYDITSSRIRRQMVKTCKDFGLERTQFSAFVGYLPRSRQALLRERLHRHLDEGAGAILILPIRSDDWWQRQEIRQDAPGDGISTVSSAAIDRPAPPALY